MTTSRKDYTPLPDSRLDQLKADAARAGSSRFGSITLPASTLYALVSEVGHAREEIFRLQICETVEMILNEELEDETEVDHLSFQWPGEFAPEDDILNAVLMQTATNEATSRLTRIEASTPITDDPGAASGRFPRVD